MWGRGARQKFHLKGARRGTTKEKTPKRKEEKKGWSAIRKRKGGRLFGIRFQRPRNGKKNGPRKTSVRDKGSMCTKMQPKGVFAIEEILGKKGERKSS